ncbi:TPA: hypothetical protein SMF87_004535 [Serratia marcescens]|nr:hypothetical protein [Serratia marcescens]
MCQELALKFSSAPLEQLLSVLPPEEAIEVIRNRLRLEIREELEVEFESQISELEEQSAENYGSMETFKISYEGLSEAVEKAVDLPWTEALPILRAALEECNPYDEG